MGNHPTDPRAVYADALAQAADDLDDALAAIRAETTAGRVTPAEAATERAGLLERHLARLAELRAKYVGTGEDDDGPGLGEAYYCATCGATIGIFLGHGDGWHHFRGSGTPEDPNVLYDAGHEAAPGGMIP